VTIEEKLAVLEQKLQAMEQDLQIANREIKTARSVLIPFDDRLAARGGPATTEELARIVVDRIIASGVIEAAKDVMIADLKLSIDKLTVIRDQSPEARSGIVRIDIHTAVEFIDGHSRELETHLDTQ